jgi:hypothetical protein
VVEGFPHNADKLTAGEVNAVDVGYREESVPIVVPRNRVQQVGILDCIFEDQCSVIFGMRHEGASATI